MQAPETRKILKLYLCLILIAAQATAQIQAACARKSSQSTAASQNDDEASSDSITLFLRRHMLPPQTKSEKDSGKSKSKSKSSKAGNATATKRDSSSGKAPLETADQQPHDDDSEQTGNQNLTSRSASHLGIAPQVLLQPHFFLSAGKQHTAARRKTTNQATTVDSSEVEKGAATKVGQRSTNSPGAGLGSGEEAKDEERSDTQTREQVLTEAKEDFYTAPGAACDQRFTKIINRMILQHFATTPQASVLDKNVEELRKKAGGKKKKKQTLFELQVAEKAKQLYAYDLHTKLLNCLTEIAMSLGIPDKKRAKEVFTTGMTSLRSLVGEDDSNSAAKAIAAYVRSVQVPENIFAGVLWSDTERNAKLDAIEQQIRVQRPAAGKDELKMLDSEATKALDNYKFAILTQNRSLLSFTREMIAEMTNAPESERILTSHLSIEAPVMVPKLKLEPDDDGL